MSILTLLITIGKELLPFLKESLLEGQTFKTWFKSNWLTFAWLINTLALMLMVAHLSDLVSTARRNETRLEAQWGKILPPLQDILLDYKQLKTDNAALRKEVADLRTQNETYEGWMTACGVNYQDAGQCKVIQPPRAQTRKPKTKTQRPQTPPEPKEKPGFTQRIRDLLRNGSDD